MSAFVSDASFSPMVIHPNLCCDQARIFHLVQGCCEPFNGACLFLIKSERALSPGFVWISLAIIEERKSASGQKKGRQTGRPRQLRLTGGCYFNALETLLKVVFNCVPRP